MSSDAATSADVNWAILSMKLIPFCSAVTLQPSKSKSPSLVSKKNIKNKFLSQKKKGFNLYIYSKSILNR